MRTLAAVLVAAMLAACSTSPSGAPASTTSTEAASEQASATTETTAVGSVKVPRDGTQFNPPVHKDQIPQGAYYCDMGDVHYARITPGDGSCPVCGMELTKKE